MPSRWRERSLAEPAQFLIAALSARALAASARRAGQSAVALDLFGDEDLQAAVLDHAVVAGDPFGGFDEAALLAAAERLAPAGRGHRLVYGGGFEARPELLTALGRGRAICGNAPEVLAHLKDPGIFFALLDRLGLPHPEVALVPPADPAGWLVKRIGGAGGSHVRPAGNAEPAPGTYYQRHADGRPVSALIVGDGQWGRLLGFSEQWPSPDGAAQPFRFGGAAQPAIVPSAVVAAIAAALDPLIRASGLRGLASLEAVDPVEPDAQGIRAIGIEIGERRHMAAAVPFLAVDGAGMTTDADVEIDDEAELLRAGGRQAGHRPRSCRPRNWAPWRRISGAGARPGGRGKGWNCGEVSAASSALAFTMRTLRSYQAAWPVTGSLLE